MLASDMASVEPAARLYNQGMILRRIGLLLLLVLPLMGEIRKMTLRQAVERAIEQNPDLALARLDQRTATESVHIARDAFTQSLQVAAVVNFPTKRVAGFDSQVLVLAVDNGKGEHVLLMPERPVPDGRKVS